MTSKDQRNKKVSWWGAEYLLPDPSAPGSIPSVPKKISDQKIVDVAEVNQRRCLEESGQWLENVDQTQHNWVLFQFCLIFKKN